MSPRTPSTLTTPEAVLSQLDAVRRNGYSLDNGENDENVRCIGSAIFDRRSEVIGAVSISGPDFRVTDAFIAEMAPAVIECAVDISATIGLPREENPLSPHVKQDPRTSH